MKETQIQHLLRLFQENGNKLTLGMILKTNLGAAYRPRLSDLREKGYTVDCVEDKKEPSNNLYTLIIPGKQPIVCANRPCLCGSWYKRGDKCNKCGKVVS